MLTPLPSCVSSIIVLDLLAKPQHFCVMFLVCDVLNHLRNETVGVNTKENVLILLFKEFWITNYFV